MVVVTTGIISPEAQAKVTKRSHHHRQPQQHSQIAESQQLNSFNDDDEDENNSNSKASRLTKENDRHDSKIGTTVATKRSKMVIKQHRA